MRRRWFLFGITSIVIVGMLLNSCAPAVTFPDPRLEMAIREAIGKPEGTIHTTDLTSLTDFECSLGHISDLSGLENCANLTHLRLSQNEISDLSPLSSLTKLTDLFLDQNQISNISPLSSLTSLSSLHLPYNKISDISSLSSLTNLTYLNLSVNQITDISPLSGLTKISVLYLTNNQISNVLPLASLTNLKTLWLQQNQISDISPLLHVTNQTELHLRQNPLSANSVNILIPQLIAKGVRVEYDVSPITVVDMVIGWKSVAPGSSGPPINVRIFNTSNRSISTGKITIGGPDAADFYVQNDGISNQTIAPGAVAGLQVVFAPSQPGKKSAVLHIWLEDEEIAPGTVELQGMALITEPTPTPPAPAPAPPPPEEKAEPNDLVFYTNKETGISFHYPPEWGEVVDYVDYFLRLTTKEEPEELSEEEKEAIEAFQSVYRDSLHYGHYLAFSNLDMDWATHIRITSAENIQSFVSETNKSFASLPETIQERSSLRYLPLLGFWGSVVLLQNPSLLEQLPQNVRDIAALPEGASPEELKDTAQPVLILFANGIRYLLVPLEETHGQIATSDGKLRGVTQIGTEGFDVGGRDYWDCILTTSDGERLVYISFSLQSPDSGVEESLEEQQTQFIEFTKSITLLK